MKFKRLVTNEIIKLWRRTGVKVFIFITLAVALLSSVSPVSFYNGFEADFDSLFSRAGNSSKRGSEIYEIKKRAIENGIESGEWRMQPLTVIVNNTDQINWLKEDGDYYDLDDKKYQEHLESNKETIKILEAEIAVCWSIIESNDFKQYIAGKKAGSVQSIDPARLSDWKKEITADSNRLTDAEHALVEKYFEVVSKIYDIGAGFFDHALAADMEGSAADTRLVDSVSNICLTQSSYLKTKSDFEVDPYADFMSSFDNGFGFGFGTKGIYSRNEYGRYLEDCIEDAEKTLEKLLVADYAAVNRVDEMTTANSARINHLSLVTSAFFSFITLLGIYCACSSVAAEFSRKTINMVVIRPISRREVTASKYVACLLVIYAVSLAGLLAGAFFGGVVHGMGDLFQPYIYVSGGEAHAFPFLLWHLWRAFVASINVVFYMTLAFMLSMLIRRTAASMIISFAFYVFSDVIQLIRFGLANLIGGEALVGLLKWLPMSYLSFRTTVFDDIPRLHTYFNIGSINAMLTDLWNGGGQGLLYGSVLLAALCAVMYIIADRSFIKRDIKS